MAYKLFKEHNIHYFYFYGQKKRLNIDVVKNDIIQKHLEICLSYKNNEFSNLISKIKAEVECDPEKIQIFQNNSELDPIDPNVDLKKYSDIGLIMYTFPINAQLNYLNEEKTFSFKFNRPIRNYLKEISHLFHFQSSKQIFKINEEIISYDVPIHSILENFEDPITITIEDIIQNKMLSSTTKQSKKKFIPKVSYVNDDLESLMEENIRLREENSKLRAKLKSYESQSSSKSDNISMNSKPFTLIDVDEIDSLRRVKLIGRGNNSRVYMVSCDFALKELDLFCEENRDTTELFEKSRALLRDIEMMNIIFHRFFLSSV
ncbi:hypothetical protein M9Y10_037035 [Tritrichomonas musculus]|uniref:Protein kinase domain-containing protein n=1 Tax=Tritrichomonas musculus TaxID=1915356 RepID=A0ABR2GSS6_9EUKA